jgi:hypothetical protein
MRSFILRLKNEGILARSVVVVVMTLCVLRDCVGM